ncbi:MAG TPA: four helix bundle protein [Bacteroidia bacterium]
MQFCRHSKGSLNEVLDHLICAHDCDYIDKATLDDYRK